jgi:hypothetical protein
VLAHDEIRSGPTATASASAFAKRETFSGAHPRDGDTEGACSMYRVNYGPAWSENHLKRAAEAAQKEAIYRAATLEIQDVLGSCSLREDKITVNDMDIIHKAFDVFMRSHRTLSDGYIRLTGGISDPFTSVSMPPPPPPPPRLQPSQPTAYQKDDPAPCPPSFGLKNPTQLRMVPPNHDPAVNGFQEPINLA